MKYRLFLPLVFIIFLNCPKRHTPDIDRIEVAYLSSLYSDIQKDTPLLASIKTMDGIAIGHMLNEPPINIVVMGKLGFFDLLSETGLDFVIVDRKYVHLDNVNYFIIPYDLGYAITNYEGIRFAIVSKHKDSLSIEDMVTLEIVRQRSDVMWIIDSAFIQTKPMLYSFHIKNRNLADTSITGFEPIFDTSLVRRVRDFSTKFVEVMEKNINIGEQSLRAFTLQRLAQNEKVDIILYEPALFKEDPESEHMLVREFVQAVACEQQFQKRTMTREEILTMADDEGYELWGSPSDTNEVLYPVIQGQYLFDLLSLVTIPSKY